jgi:hypothetical protein
MISIDAHSEGNDQSGVGKSSLINEAFSVDKAVAFYSLFRNSE